MTHFNSFNSFVLLALVCAILIRESTAFVMAPLVVVTEYASSDCTGASMTSAPMPFPPFCDSFGDLTLGVLNNGVPLVNVSAVQIVCPEGTLRYGVNMPDQDVCSSGTAPLDSICFGDAIGPGLSARVSCIPDICRPAPNMPKQQCDNRVAQCAAWYTPMKWTNKGCKGRNGRPLGDGGCQCKGYCAYDCKQACRRDPECFWNNRARMCHSKASGMPGLPIPKCSFVPPPNPSPARSSETYRKGVSSSSTEGNKPKGIFQMFKDALESNNDDDSEDLDGEEEDGDDVDGDA